MQQFVLAWIEAGGQRSRPERYTYPSPRRARSGGERPLLAAAARNNGASLARAIHGCCSPHSSRLLLDIKLIRRVGFGVRLHEFRHGEYARSKLVDNVDGRVGPTIISGCGVPCWVAFSVVSIEGAAIIQIKAKVLKTRLNGVGNDMDQKMSAPSGYFC